MKPRNLAKLLIEANQQIEEKNYWFCKLSGDLPKSFFPFDYTERDISPAADITHSADFKFAGDILARLEKLSNRSDEVLHIILLTALILLLYKYTGKQDILVGMPIYKEDNPNSINTALAIRSHLGSQMNFKELLILVRQTVIEANEYANYPIEILAKQLEIPYIFNTALLLENIQAKDALANITVDMLFRFLKTNGIIEAHIEYNSGLYKKATVQRIISHFVCLLENALDNPGLKISEIEILSGEEKEFLLFSFNSSAHEDYPRERVIHELFAEQAVIMPDSIAVIFNNRQLSYRALAKRADGIAGLLRQKGLNRGNIVGILLNPSVSMIIALLGVLKGGGGYLPIDPGYPGERIRYMLQDSGTGFIVTSKDISGNISLPGQPIYLDDNQSPGENQFNPVNKNNPTDLAYIIYTSGTTGKPKGVMIEHKNVVRLLFNDAPLFDFNHNDTWTMFHSYCFDFSVWEIYGALLFGGRLVIIPRMAAKDPAKFLAILKQENVTVLNQTPSAFYNLIEEELKKPANQLNVRYVIFGGEALSPLKLKAWKDKYPTVKLINMFGITETTVHVTYKEIKDKEIDNNISNIGKPITTTSVYLMDGDFKLLPLAAEGELYVGGDGVGRGYLNRPELTMERFMKNPYRKEERLYRSGDMARLADYLELEYLGRIDSQVQLRGFRIEVGEIESRLLSYQGIKDVVVIVMGEEQHKYLCAYFTADKEYHAIELKEYLADKLPDYMIPTYFVQLEKIPLTPNGKIDRKALPLPGVKGGSRYTAPRNEWEAKLAEIWEKELNLEKVGISDNYFNVGGDSIKAIKLLNVINKAFETKLEIIDLYTNPTVEMLAGKVKQSGTSMAASDIEHRQEVLANLENLKNKILSEYKFPGEVSDIYPMSDIEKGMIFYSLKIRDTYSPMYHDQFVYQLEYIDFDEKIFKKALEFLVENHSILRTTFDLKNFEEPIHLIYAGVPIDFIHGDISARGKDEQEVYINDFLQRDRQNPFDLGSPPLWRMRTFALGSGRILALWIFHHAILDGWSNASLMTELHNTYIRLKQDSHYIPAKLKYSYKDFIVDQLIQKQKEEVKEFWKHELSDYNRLVFNDLREGNTAKGMQKYVYDLGIPFLKRLEAISSLYNVGLKSLLFSAYLYIMSMFSYNKDIVVGLVTNNRPLCEGGEKILGCFLNTIPFRLKIPVSIPLLEYVRMVDEKLISLKPYERLSLYEILKSSGEVSQDSNPLFDVLFNYVDFHVYDEAIGEGNVISSEYLLNVNGFENTNTLFDFTINCTNNQFVLLLSYHEAFINTPIIKKLCTCFANILDKFIHSSEIKIDNNELIPGEDKEKLLFELNDTSAGYPEAKTLDQLFAEQAEIGRDKIALVFEREQLTYNYLDKMADHVAYILRTKGITPGNIVSLLFTPSFEMIAAILGVLKAGGAYLPIDPDYPQERIDYMLKDSNAAILLTDKKENNCQFSIVNSQLSMRECLRSGLQHSALDLPRILHSNHLCYIIYTSGTTGKPKGMLIEHRNVVRLLFNDKNLFDFCSQDVWTLFHSYCFDFSVWEMYGALLYGGKLIIIPKMVVKDPGSYLSILKTNDVTILNQTPSAFYNLINEEIKESAADLKVRYVIFGGEALSPLKLKKWKTRYPDTKLINMFGITETTVHVTYKEIGIEEIERNISNIGKPIPTTTTYIMDINQKLLFPGIAGELCVGGDGVGRGYLNRPELTAEKFIRNPYKQKDRLYRSGDLGRAAQNMDLEYLGRIDTQVQLRGFRIELGEIESRLLKLKGIKESVVIAREDGVDTYLTAYIVSDSEFSISQLREYLLESLPVYMVPSYFMQISRIPLTSNGKVDKKALPLPEIKAGDTYVPPSNEDEKKMVNIWEKQLGLEKIGIKDNFFNLGGDSIKAIRLLNEINKTFTAELKIVDLYTDNTIEKLTQRLKQISASGNPEEAKLLKEIESFKNEILLANRFEQEIEDIYPLSDIEMGLMYYYIQDDIAPMYHDQFFYQVECPDFDLERFKKALSLMVEKHSILRTSFYKHDFGSLVHIAHAKVQLPLEYFDISGKTTVDQETFIKKITRENLGKPFNASVPPLWRMLIFDCGDSRICVGMVFHHAILDGWSNASFMVELNATYLKLKDDTAFQPNKLKFTYKQYVVEQILEKKNHEIIDFWQKELKDYNRLRLSGKEKLENEPNKRYSRQLPVSLFEMLRQFAVRYNTTIKNICLAAYIYVMNIFSYQNDVVIGLTTHSRPICEDGDKILGMFVNTIPVRIKVPENSTWLEYTQIVTQKALELKKYERISLFEILRIIGEKARDKNPIFDTIFGYLDFHIYQQKDLVTNRFQIEDTMAIEQFENSNTQFDFIINTSFGGFENIVYFAPAVFSSEMTERLCIHFENILNKIVTDPESITGLENISLNNDKQAVTPDILAAKAEISAINFEF